MTICTALMTRLAIRGWRQYSLIACLLTAGELACAGEGSLMGPKPYNFPARNAQSAAILYESKRTEPSRSSATGASAIYSNTTISATNWQQIEMTLGDDSDASLITDSTQSSTNGNASSNSEFFNVLEESSDATSRQ